MPVDGDIAKNAQAQLPITWRALDESPAYGTAFLQQLRDNIAINLFGDNTFTATEEAQLDALVKEYAGICLALDIIIPGLDYWANQPTSVTARGREEQKTYPNRANELRELYKILLERKSDLWPDVEPLLPVRRVGHASVPQVALLDSGHTTPNPYDFERPYLDPAEVPQ